MFWGCPPYPSSIKNCCLKGKVVVLGKILTASLSKTARFCLSLVGPSHFTIPLGDYSERPNNQSASLLHSLGREVVQPAMLCTYSCSEIHLIAPTSTDVHRRAWDRVISWQHWPQDNSYFLPEECDDKHPKCWETKSEENSGSGIELTVLSKTPPSKHFK